MPRWSWFLLLFWSCICICHILKWHACSNAIERLLVAKWLIVPQRYTSSAATLLLIHRVIFFNLQVLKVINLAVISEEVLVHRVSEPLLGQLLSHLNLAVRAMVHVGAELVLERGRGWHGTLRGALPLADMWAAHACQEINLLLPHLAIKRNPAAIFRYWVALVVKLLGLLLLVQVFELERWCAGGLLVLLYLRTAHEWLS